MQRTEPPAISMVGTDNGTICVACSITCLCSGRRLATARSDMARNRRPSPPVNSSAFPANSPICSLLSPMISRPDSARRARISSRRTWVLHQVETDQGELRGHAHQHVRVVDGLAGPIGGVEHHGFEIEVGGEALQSHRMGAMGARGIGHPGHMVQHHGPRALEKEAIGFETGVVDDVLHPVSRLEHLDHVQASLPAPVGRVHGIHRDVTARVGGEPVVGKNRVGGIAVAQVLEEMNPHPVLFEDGGGHGHFVIGRLGQSRSRNLRRSVLEAVVRRGLGIEGEGVGANHDHRTRGLDRTNGSHRLSFTRGILGNVASFALPRIQ